MDNSFRKAYTSRTARQPSGKLAERLKADPQLSLVTLPNMVAAQGALPIMIGEDVVGAAGASGAPGGEKDEACIQTGLDKVKDQLVSQCPGVARHGHEDQLGQGIRRRELRRVVAVEMMDGETGVSSCIFRCSGRCTERSCLASI